MRFVTCLTAIATLACVSCESPSQTKKKNAPARSPDRLSEPERHRDEAMRTWRIEGENSLVLAQPNRNSSDLPDDIALSLKCEPGSLSMVASDIVLSSDVGGGIPPLGQDFVAIELASGGFRLTGRFGEEGNGYGSWATGRFHLGEGDIEGFAQGRDLVVRPILASHRAARFAGQDAKAMIYPSPPANVRDMFVRACRTLSRQMY